MKLVSIFFTASASIFEIYLKYSKKIVQRGDIGKIIHSNTINRILKVLSNFEILKYDVIKPY